MAMKTVSIPWASWYGKNPLVLPFPKNWKIRVAAMADGPDMGEREIREAFARPIGQEPLRRIAAGKKTAAIAVDDLSRPTQAYRFLPWILEELHQGGIHDENIRIVMAIGAHRPMLKGDQIKKLGRKIVHSYPVYNSHPYENLVDLGFTSRGTPLKINRFFAEADVKIGVGFITPHQSAGFGGGGKIVVPGLAAMETIEKNHTPAYTGKVGGIAGAIENELRLDMEEGARMAGLDTIVNAVGTSGGKTAGLFVGDLVQAHRAAVTMAQKNYATEVPLHADVGIFNAFPEDTELGQSNKALNLWTGKTDRPLVKPGGTVVITTASSEGLGIHFLWDRGMRLFRRADQNKEVRAIFHGRTVIVFSPRSSPSDLLEKYPEGTILCNRWDDVLSELKKRRGSQQVTVFPNGSLQHVL